MASSEPYRPIVRMESLDASASLTLDLRRKDSSVKFNSWMKMPDCDEFVGARRSKHTSVSYKGAIYVFGGDNGKSMLNDLLRFDVKEKSWGRALTIDSPPPPRYHHTAVIYNGSMFIFGGYTGDIHSNSNLTNKNDLHEYKFATGQWIEWKFSGRRPVARAAHGAAVYNDKMWVFAGYDGNMRLNDMWTVSLLGGSPSVPRHWAQVDQEGDIPPTCCNFALTVCADSMYVFSGQSGARITNNLYQFNFTNNIWSRVSTDHIVRGGPHPPKKRYGHTMVTYNNSLYVFGGATGQLLPNDIHSFDLATQQWDVVKPADDIETPTGRLFHACAVVHDGMYIFGGTVDNNIRSGEIFKFPFSSYPKCTVLSDFERLLTEEQFCDVTFIVSSSQEEVKAHSAMVAARSSILRTRLLEAEEDHATGMKKVAVPNTSVQAFKFLLSYIYSDAIHPTRNGANPASTTVLQTMTDVYLLSVQLNMKRLEMLCIRYLQTHLSLTNVLSVLTYSHQLSLPRIKEYCMRFIVKGVNMKDVVMCSEFEQLPKSLIVEVVRTSMSQSTVMSNFAQPPDIPEDSSLVDDMRVFLSTHGKQFCDITLLLDDIEIPAHKVILAARSCYFEAMFRNFMPKDKRVQISIGNTIPSRKAFDSLLRYIYFGDVSMTPADSLYLFPASHFYGFSNNLLQAYCKQNLELNVCTDNVIQLLETAHVIGALDMKQHALDRIIGNFSTVARSPQMKTLSKELLLEIIELIAQRQHISDQGTRRDIDLENDIYY